MSRVKRALLFISLALMSCSGPTETDDSLNRPRGSLTGLVTIGPNCPAAQEPCPTPMSAFDDRKVLVFNESRSRMVATVAINGLGFYRVDLLPGKYVVDYKGIGMDRTSDVPKTVSINTFVGTRLDIRVDTGIR